MFRLESHLDSAQPGEAPGPAGRQQDFATADRAKTVDLCGALMSGAWLDRFDELLHDVLGSSDEPEFVPFHFMKCGRERFACGKTGRVLDVLVFVGMVNMHKLVHFVSDKKSTRPSRRRRT